MSLLQADDNIIHYAISVFSFLERAKTLDAEEKELFKALLRDSNYFGPTTIELVKRGFYFSSWEADKALERYFSTM
jgi:hypothetical protein